MNTKTNTTNSNQLPPHLKALLGKYDDFLHVEFARIRNAPENQPNAQGEYEELCYNLIVALSKTKGLGFVQSLDTVHDFLERNAPEILLPQETDAGWAQMKRMREKLRAYVVDEAHQVVQAKKWWQFWRQ